MIIEVITDYEVVKAENWDDLSEKVRAYLIKGYQPQGGLATAIAMDFAGIPASSYFQAMVKVERKEVQK